MSSLLIHHNEKFFPDPLKFDPQRWMGEKKRQYLERYLVSFSKGTRNCAGIKYVDFGPIIHTPNENLGPSSPCRSDFLKLRNQKLMMAHTNLLE